MGNFFLSYEVMCELYCNIFGILNFYYLPGRLKQVSEAVGFKHLMKYACKNSDGELYYPFAQHPRFKFWAYDRRRRHSSLEQTRIFFQQNPEEANFSIKDLKSRINTGILIIGY